MDKEKGSVVVSRKELIERDKSKTDEIVSELLENKNPVVGTIKKITSYGMFVDVGGMDGLGSLLTDLSQRTCKPF